MRRFVVLWTVAEGAESRPSGVIVHGTHNEAVVAPPSYGLALLRGPSGGIVHRRRVYAGVVLPAIGRVPGIPGGEDVEDIGVYGRGHVHLPFELIGLGLVSPAQV